ncbi:LysE family translocator [Pseudalkalibacillus berkeleyi]|uniref:LysE family translocator n=1 Tax=Pseudalkalibacillus berkeleyi TaxID=1069813 RepID=A0ABS9H0P2_9BACL|nr:LysE family translocator [Pseudalkalibacillus berkeleyi]MCF6137362.1 LysE family translocator [Pseudalkalibacillus berkeleyi]
MDINTILYFIFASILLTITPGPDFMFVFAQSVSHGKKAGIATGLGLCTGLIGHTFAAAVGISAIIYQSSLAFTLIKIVGAIYLLYLAIQAFRENSQPETKEVKQYSLSALYRKGILMNILNPKVSIFFLAFLPQFVSMKQGSIPMQMTILGVLFIIQALLIFVVLSISAGSVGERLWGNQTVVKWINRMKGSVFAFFSIRLLFEQK